MAVVPEVLTGSVFSERRLEDQLAARGLENVIGLFWVGSGCSLSDKRSLSAISGCTAGNWRIADRTGAGRHRPVRPRSRNRPSGRYKRSEEVLHDSGRGEDDRPVAGLCLMIDS